MDVSLDYKKDFLVWIHGVPEEVINAENIKVERRCMKHGEINPNLAPRIFIGDIEIILIKETT